MIKVKLIVVGGDAKRTEVALKQLPATIGRAREASVTLPHSLVSRKHCEIYEEQDRLFVRDLNSLNGTYLNSEKIVGSKTILPGQLLTLGNVTFRADFEVVQNQNQSDDLVDQEHAVTEELQTDETCDVGFEQQECFIDDVETEHAPAKPSPKDSETPFVFEAIGDTAAASISLGALRNLPESGPSDSFSDPQVESGDPLVQVDPETVQIHPHERQSNETAPSESSLNDFFRKMPR